MANESGRIHTASRRVFICTFSVKAAPELPALSDSSCECESESKKQEAMTKYQREKQIGISIGRIGQVQRRTANAGPTGNKTTSLAGIVTGTADKAKMDGDLRHNRKK